MRWLVGDVHGCVRALERLLEAVRFERGRDELWAVGDLVRGGPESLEVLRIWEDVDGRGVLGNHDAHALLEASGREPRVPELKALFAAADGQRLLDRLRALPILAHLPPIDGARDAWVVHAGLKPSWKELDRVALAINAGDHGDKWLETPDVLFATRARCCTPSGERVPHKGPPHDCPAGSRPWDDFYEGEALVVHGHWSHRGFYRLSTTLGLDSGCMYGGPLTGWCHEEDRVVQVAGGD